MKLGIFTFCFSSAFLINTVMAEAPTIVSGTDPAKAHASHPTMKEHSGSNEIQKGEYEIIDTSGSTTRALCPYTCADRGLPAEYCKAFPSQNEPQLCYIQDTRIPSNAFENK